MKKIILIILFVILLLSAFLRFYKLDQVPASLNWDEVAAGYNAFTIANWGADEYGNKFPIVFKNFGDDKHPVHIYITALVVKIFGLSDFSTRASSAAVGVLAVFAIFILAKEIFKKTSAGLFSALFLAVSPYAIHFSRGLWETNFALFFFISGCAVFYIAVKRQNWFIPLSFVFWGLSVFSYQSAEVVVPPLVLLLCLIYFKDIIRNKKLLVWSAGIVLLFAGLIIKDPRILGFARINQTKFSETVINKYGGEMGTVIHNYKGYFTYPYLFLSGDQNPRGSVKIIGEFYKIDLILFLAGFAAIIFQKKWKVLLLISAWLILSPIPGAVSMVEPNAIRGIFMIAPVMLLSGYGAATLFLIFKNNWIKSAILIIILGFLSLEVAHYLNYYFNEYPKKDAIEWQYGMKESALYALAHPEYGMVYVDKMRQQPYIFFLFYLKEPLPLLLKTVKYDQTPSYTFNTVSSFGKYNFGNWDPIESYPSPGILYIITPSFYTGLRFINDFDVKKLVKYPDGSNAFYLVSGKE